MLVTRVVPGFSRALTIGLAALALATGPATAPAAGQTPGIRLPTRPQQRPSNPRFKTRKPPPSVVVVPPTPAADLTGSMFDESANAQKDLDDALASAKRENRRVLIIWGSNTCPQSRRLCGMFSTDQELRRVLMFEYDVVRINLGNMDANMQLATAHGLTPRAENLPYLTILSGEGRTLASGDAWRLGDGHGGYDQVKAVKFLRGFQASYPGADGVLSQTLTAARNQKRLVLLHFGAPQSSQSKVFERWLDRPDVASLLGRDLVRVKIDIDRTVGGGTLMHRYTGSWQRRLPWFGVLDPSTGELLTTDAGAPCSASGIPDSERELAQFADLLRTACKSLSPAEIDALVASIQNKE